jgi:hypothetical protein
MRWGCFHHAELFDDDPVEIVRKMTPLHPAALLPDQLLDRNKPISAGMDHFVKGEASLPFIAHSQTSRIRHPAACNCSRTRASRAMSGNLGAPEFLARGGPAEQGAIVTMPETAMDKNHRAMAREYHVGFARQIPDMQAIPKAEGTAPGVSAFPVAYLPIRCLPSSGFGHRARRYQPTSAISRAGAKSTHAEHARNGRLHVARDRLDHRDDHGVAKLAVCLVSETGISHLRSPCSNHQAGTFLAVSGGAPAWPIRISEPSL